MFAKRVHHFDQQLCKYDSYLTNAVMCLLSQLTGKDISPCIDYDMTIEVCISVGRQFFLNKIYLFLQSCDIHCMVSIFDLFLLSCDIHCMVSIFDLFLQSCDIHCTVSIFDLFLQSCDIHCVVSIL